MVGPQAELLMLTVPLLDGTLYLGDVPVTIGAGGEVEVPSARLIDLLTPLLEPGTLAAILKALAGAPTIKPAALGSGLRLRYAPDQVALIVDIPLTARAHQPLPISPAGFVPGGAFEVPAGFSAYLSARGTLRMADKPVYGSAFDALLFLDGAARFRGVVLEGDGIWREGSGGSGFERRATRLVLDDPDRALRLSVGDIQTTGRGFQSAPALAGVSLIRSYGLLQPQRIVHPGGRGSFTLDLPSVVEVLVNGSLLRRVELAPGNYDLRDFPFTQGASDVRLVVRDASGRSETVRFDLYFDQAQLAPGIDEFGLFAGVYAPPGMTGPIYSDDPTITGHYRRGITDRLTLGGNLQADAQGQMAGVQMLLSGMLGTWRADAALSRDSRAGTGAAASLTFERTLGATQGGANVISLSLEGATRGFQPVGPWGQVRPYAWQLDAQYVHSFTSTLSAAVSMRWAKGWGSGERIQFYRANLDWALTPRLRFALDLTHDHDAARGPETAARIGLHFRLGAASSASANYDTASKTERLSYSRSAGDGVGAYSLLAEAERNPAGANFNADGTWITNRAELGFSRFNNLDGSGSSVTTLRAGSAIAYADGAVSIGAPIRDSFAIMTRHRALAGAELQMDATDDGYAASTGALGTAMRSDLNSYLERTIAVSSPDAPATADLGRGSFRLMPRYRSGYRLQVGSDYSVSVVGQLVDATGQPLRLVAGTAREVRPGGPTVELFTNAEGRFGAAGLRPGRWRLDFGGDPSATYAVVIPDDAGPVVALGALSPEGAAR
jgi:outer membrane usher protein